MPLVPLLIGAGLFGAGAIVGLKTSDIIRTVVIGGVVYYIVTRAVK